MAKQSKHSDLLEWKWYDWLLIIGVVISMIWLKSWYLHIIRFGE